jgi:ribosomal protein L37AE/L43A
MLAVTRTAFPLDDIAAVLVRKYERQSGRFGYGLKLSRKRGNDIALRCRTRHDAIQCHRIITEFLASP